MLVRAFIPAHITAFFVPVFHEEPLKAGSLGAGVNLSKGTNVFVSIETGTLERHIHVAFNGEPVKRGEAEITYYVAERLVSQDFFGEVEIWQYFDFPNGHGFGNSGGGALGTALALSYAFGGTWLKASQLAHEAEVIHRGGLGDVIGQGVVDLGDEKPGKSFGVPEDRPLAARFQPFEDAIDGGAREARFAGRAFNQVEGEGILFIGWQRPSLPGFLPAFALEA